MKMKRSFLQMTWLCLLVAGILATPETRADGFINTSSMSAARAFHTATLLPNGKVLVAGGFNSANNLSSAELYQPSTESWTGTGSMSDLRYGHTATLLPNGKVLVTGGFSSSTGYLSSSELYDSATGSWIATGAMTVARFGHAATLLANGKVLVIGGVNANGNSGYLASAELYDPATGAWTVTGSMSFARMSHTATLLSTGKVLVTGGISLNSGTLASAEIYDSLSGTWTMTSPMTVPQAYHAATLLQNGKVLITGAYNGSNVLSFASIFNSDTGTWSVSQAMNVGRFYHTATVLPNGKVLVSGGDVGGITTNSAELFDPTSGTWTAAGFMSVAHRLHTTTLLPNGKVLVSGGQGTNIFSRAEFFIGGTDFNNGLLDFIPVSNPGNSNDVTTGYGAVGYQYSIGKYEVTLNQYTAFLNAVAATDTYGLYNPAMDSDLNIRGIFRSGASGSFTYAVDGDGNRPVTYVSWFDAARFANWIHNGRPSGAQTAATTEDGAYTLLGATSGVGISKNSGARYWIPSEDEWYKAAYHQPASQGGDSDDYWLYPTANNFSPNSRNGSGTDANSGNFFLNDGIANGFNDGYAVSQTTGYSSSQQYLTPAGAFSVADSFYGTFDQGGNVWEWNDVVNGATRGFRGGSWGDGTDASLLQSSFRNSGVPTYEAVTVGFRIASTAAPLIAQQPQNQTVVLSNNATFTVSAVGIESFAYQWLFNSAPLAGATNASLVVSNVSGANQGNYSVIITNSYGSVTSSVAVLTLYVEPAGYAWTNFVGTPGTFGTADGTGGAAQFHSPYSVAVDNAGFSYVGDFVNRTIRKVTPAGAVTLLAGTTGAIGTTDGTGTAAQFSSPWAVDIDPSGVIFVADQESFALRKVTLAGVVTTFAGTPNVSGSTDGTGSAARFSYLNGMALDKVGNIFLSDQSHTIRKVTPAGVVTTIAGAVGVSASVDGSTNVARFIGPAGLAVAPNGDLYIADGNAIRVLSTNGIVSTIAGSPGTTGSLDGVGTAARLNAPQGLRVDAVGNIYVADQPNHTIRKITPAGVVTTIGGLAGATGTNDGVGSAARFLYPTTVAMDSAGVLYVGDSGNHRISKGTPLYGPMIVSQTGNVGIECGTTNSTNLVVTVTGQEPMTYRWYLNGNFFADTGTTNSLTGVSEIWSGFPINPAPYTCVVSNSYGSVTSSVMQVSRVDTTPPVITTGLATNLYFQPCNSPFFSYLSGSLAATDCSGTISWSQAIVGGAVNVGPPGTTNIVRITARDIFNNASSFDIQVVAATPPPTIVAPSGGEPRSVTTNAGAYAFMCAALGHIDCGGDIAIQWYKNGSPLPGATNACLIFPSVSVADAGTYQAFATNVVHIGPFPNYYITSQASLSIVGPPSVDPLTTRLVYGSDGFSLNANGSGTGPLTYQWRWNGTNIAGATGAAFAGAGLPGSAGNYDAVICNPYGCVTSSLVAVSFFGDLKFYTGTILAGGVGASYRVDYADIIGGATNSWQTLTTVTLPYSPYLVIDPYSPTQSARFYRAVQLP